MGLYNTLLDLYENIMYSCMCVSLLQYFHTAYRYKVKVSSYHVRPFIIQHWLVTRECPVKPIFTLRLYLHNKHSPYLHNILLNFLLLFRISYAQNKLHIKFKPRYFFLYLTSFTSSWANFYYVFSLHSQSTVYIHLIINWQVVYM